MGDVARRRQMAGKTTLGINIQTGEPLEMRYAGQRLTAYARDITERANRKITEQQVPCGTCRECCWYSRVEVFPEKGDDPERLDTVRADDGTLVLRKREDGACIHLTEKGCGVYDHRPAACRAYDCRLSGAMGIVDTFDSGHKSPVWKFHLDTSEDRALAMALTLGAARVMAKNPNFTAHEAAVGAWQGVQENFPKAQEFVTRVDKLSPEAREELLCDLKELLSAAMKDRDGKS